MKKLFTLSICWIFSFFCYSQSFVVNSYLPMATSTTAATDSNFLSAGEKEVIRLINMARTESPLFISTYLSDPKLKLEQEELEELKALLNNTLGLKPLKPVINLHRSAKVHALDMGKSGNKGHISSNGLFYFERIHQQMPGIRVAAENYHSGSNEPIKIVLDLLMDTTNINADYRNNLLSPKLEWVGISIQPHINLCYNTVIDFATMPDERVVYKEMKRKNKAASYYNECPKKIKVKRHKVTRKRGSLLSIIF